MFTIKDKYVSEGYSIEELRCKAMKGTVFVIPAWPTSPKFILRSTTENGWLRRLNRESFLLLGNLQKDSGQARMTEWKGNSYAVD